MNGMEDSLPVPIVLPPAERELLTSDEVLIQVISHGIDYADGDELIWRAVLVALNREHRTTRELADHYQVPLRTMQYKVQQAQTWLRELVIEITGGGA